MSLSSLPLELIGSIIKHLPKETTNTLRRVSKFWKIASENQCGNRAIKQHFPNTEAAQRTFEPQEANLTFRRLLYHQKSTERGYVTRARRYPGVMTWHLKGDSLLWADPSGTITIEDLQSQDSKVSLTSSRWKRRLNGAKYLIHAFLADQDILVAYLRESDDTDYQRSRSTQCFDGLAKISRQGDVRWNFGLETPASAHHLHMGTDIFYYTLDPTSEDSLESLFITRSVENGGVLREITLSFRAHAFSCTRDPVIQNKRWAVVHSDHGRTFVIDTSTGDAVFSTEFHDIVFNAMEDKIWEVPTPERTTPDIIRSEYLYDKQQKEFTSQVANHTAKFSKRTLCWGLDADQQLLFHIKPQKQGQKVNRRDLVPHTVSVTSLKPQHAGTEEPEMTLRYLSMTLPAHSGRRKLEVELLRDAELGVARFHPIGRYLLFHHKTCRVLVLLDFGPRW